MQTFAIACLVGSIILIFAGAPSVFRRPPGPSWFDLQPYMVEPKKARGRGQQTKRKRQR